METTTISSDATLGRALIGAIERRDFAAFEALLAPDVRFRALVPKTERSASNAGDARRIVEGWFDTADPVEEIESTVDAVVDRLHLAYRLRLREDGVWKLVEQQAFATVVDGRIADVAMVCSGFRPVLEMNAPQPEARLDATGESCATLTPRIRSAIGAIPSGTVLEVLADDPAAEEGLRSWGRLTGNELVGVESSPDPAARRFYLRRR